MHKISQSFILYLINKSSTFIWVLSSKIFNWIHVRWNQENLKNLFSFFHTQVISGVQMPKPKKSTVMKD